MELDLLVVCGQSVINRLLNKKKWDSQSAHMLTLNHNLHCELIFIHLLQSYIQTVATSKASVLPR